MSETVVAPRWAYYTTREPLPEYAEGRIPGFHWLERPARALEPLRPEWQDLPVSPRTYGVWASSIPLRQEHAKEWGAVLDPVADRREEAEKVEALLQDHVMFSRFVGRIECNDGLTLSVQASSGHYCHPKSDTGPWTSFEVGITSRHVPNLAYYTDGPGDTTKAVCGWVPVDVILGVILDAGGWKRGLA